MKRFTMFLGLGSLVFSLAWVLAPGTAEGVIPEQINLQGILRDGGGNLVADGSYSVIFTIYNAGVGGTVFWAETTSVTTTDGLFNIRLGTTNPIPDSAIRLNTWLGITLSPDPEMTPRTRLTAVSHAYKVSTVTGASGGNVTGDIYLLGSGAEDYLSLATSDPNVALELRSGTFGGDPFIDFSNDAASDYDARIQLMGNDGLQITVPSILSIPTGNVGIGTTSPTKKLDVAGSIKGDTVFSNVLSSNSPLNVQAPAGTTRAYIDDATGNIGIGTASPGTRLHILENNDTLCGLTIENPNTGTLSTEAILFNSEDGSGPANGASIFVTDGSHPNFPALMRIANFRPSGSIDFVTGGNGRILIENGGDVGIGTSNPVNKLDVEGGAAIGAAYSGTSVTPANGLLVQGNVGIGTNSPSTRLQVAGGQLSTDAGTAAAPGYTFTGDLNTGIYNPVVDAISLATGGTERVRIDNTGDVGIGTIAPDVPLHVDGGIDASLPDGSGYAVIGDVNGLNIVMDNDEIQARNNGAAATMSLQSDGGALFIAAGGGFVSIGAPTISVKLEVEQSGATVASFNRTTDDGNVIHIQQDGITEGIISVSGTTVTYGAFTGSHYGWTEEALDRGELVALTGANRNSHDNPKSEIIYGIKRSAVPNDPACLGSYLALSESNQPYSSENPHLVMAVGNGDMWVVDKGQNIQPGDYLISSFTPGHAMKDDEEKYPIGHIVARAAEEVDWSTVSEMSGGRRHKKISVLFGNFVRSNPSGVTKALEGLQEIILKQQEEIEKLKQAVLKDGSSVMAETKR